MKFIVKFLVLLMVLLSIFANKARRTTTLSKTKLKAQANIEARCYDFNRSQNKLLDQWVVLDTASANSSGSGIFIRNYYASENFNCKHMIQLGKVNGYHRFFFSYRNFSTADPSQSSGNILKKIKYFNS